MTGEGPANGDRVEAGPAELAEVADAGPATAPAARKQAILVLGMHRCGTSAVTGMISLLGADLPSQLMPGQPGNNESGFWESTEIAALHDDLLAVAGSSWDEVAEFPRAWFETEQAEAYRGRLLAILEQDFSASTLFVVKDPRACRLVPLWVATLSAFGAEPSFVIPLRNPLEVAASLKARDDLAPARSWLLWLSHVLAAEKDTRPFRRSFIAFDELLSDWRAVAARVSEELDIPWPRQGQQATTEIDGFLAQRYRHHRFESRELAERPDVPTWVKRVWAAVSDQGKGRKVEDRVLDRVRSELRIAERTFGPIVAADRLQLAARRQEIERLEGELAVRADESESQRCELQRSRRQVEELRAEAARTAGELAARRQDVGELRRDLAEKRAEVERLADAGVRRKSLATRLEQLATEQRLTLEQLRRSASTMQETTQLHREETVARLGEEVVRLEGEVVRLEGELARLEREVPRLDKEVARLGARVARRNEEVERLRSEAARRDDDVERLEAQLTRRDDDVERLEAQLTRRDELLSGLRETAESRATQLAARDRQLARHQAENRQLQSALADRKAWIERLEMELAGLRRELDERSAELSAARAGVAATSDELAALQRRVREHEHEERRVLTQILQAAGPGAE